MLVTLRLTGYLSVRAGLKPGEVLQFDLPAQSTLNDLYSAFDAKMGAHMPANLWNRETLSFHDSIMVMVNNQQQKERGYQLQEGSSVTALLPIAGG